MAVYIYLVASAALVLISDIFMSVFREPYSWWLVPLLFVGFFIALVAVHMIFTFAWIMTINTKKPTGKRRAFRKWITVTIDMLMKIVRVSVNTSGTEKVPTDRKLLFVCNHQHDLDPIMILSVFPDNEIGFIGKKEIYKTMPLIGKAMHGLGSLPIDRENNREAAKTIIEAAHMLGDGRFSIGLFPEGYVSRSCELQPLRNGSLKIAYRAKAPIAVCVINNTRSIPKRMFFRHTEVELRVIRVMEYEEYADMSTQELGDLIHGEMKKELDEIRGAQKQ